MALIVVVNIGASRACSAITPQSSTVPLGGIEEPIGRIAVLLKDHVITNDHFIQARSTINSFGNICVPVLQARKPNGIDICGDKRIL